MAVRSVTRRERPFSFIGENKVGLKIRWLVIGFISALFLVRTGRVFTSGLLGGSCEEAPEVIKHEAYAKAKGEGGAVWPRVLSKDEEPLTQQEKSFWKQPDAEGWQPCLDKSEDYRQQSEKVLKSEIYIVAVVTGGLNQMRRQIGTAVVIARVLQASLVVPVLSYNGIWKDHSEFADLFDVAHFRQVLNSDVRIVTSLPVAHLRMTHAVERQPKLGASPEWLFENLYRQLRKDHVMIIRGLDGALADDLPLDLQRLRCKVEFEALKFSPIIQEIGQKLASRMAAEGPYVALHLRLEKDVWVRTGCLPGLGEELDQGIVRERELKPELLTARSNLTFEQRLQNGLCPLSAAMVVRILKALGASKRTRIFWAGGEPYGGDVALAPLKEAFAEIHTKWTLAESTEMAHVARHGNMLAAIDFIIALESDVFMPSHGGNMAHVLQGHRAFFGPRKFVMPNKRKLVAQLLQDRGGGGLPVGDFEAAVKEAQGDTSSRMQLRTARQGRDVIGYPAPECMCQQQQQS